MFTRAEFGKEVQYTDSRSSYPSIETTLLTERFSALATTLGFTETSIVCLICRYLSLSRRFSRVQVLNLTHPQPLIAMFIANDAPDTPANIRWRRCEKAFLVAVTVVSVSNIVLNALSLSDRVSSQHKLAGLGATIWTDSSKADLSDGQLKSFRANLPLLTVGAVAFIAIRKWWQSLGDNKGEKAQLQFYVASGVAICLYLHGPGLVFLLLWASANYYLSLFTLRLKYFSVAVWVANLAFLVLTEHYNGYRFRWLGLPSLVNSTQDSFHPELPWFRSSNLCFLKLISFLLDAHWSAIGVPATPKEVPLT